MKLNKRLLKLTTKMSLLSFNKNGSLDEKKAKGFTQSLVKLPHQEAVLSLSHYLKLLKQEVGKRTLVIESAAEVNQEQEKNIVKSLEKQYQIVSVEKKVNPSLLGGIRVKIGDVIFDDSVESRIKQMGDVISNM